MLNHEGIIDVNRPPLISQSDKLWFCVFLATAFHGMLLFGIGFKLPDPSKSQYSKVFNVVLAQFNAESKPEKADFIGQADQEAGGESDKLLAPSTTEIAQFNDPNQNASEPQYMKSSVQLESPQTEVLTGNGEQTTDYKVDQKSVTKNTIPDAASLIDKSYRLTGLIANLDNENVNQAKKARKRVVSAAIHRSSDALYLDTWRRKIERIGNLNYPEKAKLNKIYGNLTMKVGINRDGTIREVSIVQSSGIKTLDDAALRIIRIAAPFNPLTKEMTKDTDVLEIIRIWQFKPDYQLKTN